MDLPGVVREEMILKVEIFWGLSVIENREIVLLQIRDGLAPAVRHYVHFNQPRVDAENIAVLGYDGLGCGGQAEKSRPLDRSRHLTRRYDAGVRPEVSGSLHHLVMGPVGPKRQERRDQHPDRANRNRNCQRISRPYWDYETSNR